MSGKSPLDKGAGAMGVGAIAMLACCGTHLLAIGAVGGIAAGTFFGVAVGAVAFFALVAAVVVRQRRRIACAPRSAASSPPFIASPDDSESPRKDPHGVA